MIFHQRCFGGMVVAMTKTTTIPDELRHAALTVVTGRLTAGGVGPSQAAIEAALDAATAYLVDAYLIEEAIEAATDDAPPPVVVGRQPQDIWQEVGGKVDQYLRLLQERGSLRLQTVRLDDEPPPDEDDH